MLFRGIENYLFVNSKPRVMPHLKQYIETLNTRRVLQQDRSDNAPGYESNLVVLLRKILADADIPTLLSKSNDADCYFDILVYTAPGLNAIFDAVTTGLSFYDMAIRRSAVHTEEFFIPVTCQDPPDDLPFDLGWDKWQSVKPLRLVDIDSQELTFATYQDQIVFSSQPPTRAVMTIDVVALVLQYVTFLRTSDQVLPQPEYLHRYVVTPLLQDLQDLWLANIYGMMLSQPTWFITDPKQCLATIAGDTRYGFQGTELPIALREISSAISACQGGVINPSVLVQSLLLSDDNIPTYLETLINTISIEDHRQNFWMETLKDIRWLNILLSAYQLQPDFIGTKNLHTNLRRDVPIVYAMRPWQNCRSTRTSQVIQNILKELLIKSK
jgi:hypothetical protein